MNRVISICLLALSPSVFCADLSAEQLLAGVATVDITDRAAGPVNDPLYVKALIISSSDQSFALITLDAVAIGEIGRIKNDYLPEVRSEIAKRFGIKPMNVMANANHCHGVVRSDVAKLTLQAVQEAFDSREPSVSDPVGDREIDHGKPSLASEERSAPSM